MLYSASTSGFYHPDININIPTDAVKLSKSQYNDLIIAQSNGATIMPDPIKKIPIAKYPDAPTLAELIDTKLNKLAEYRYNIEIKGVSINGINIKTDRESQLQLNNVYTTLKNEIITETYWKGENGWITITLQNITYIVQVVANHVKNCFMNEKHHSDKIKKLKTIATVNNYDFSTGWAI